MKKLIALGAVVAVATTGAVVAATDDPPPRPAWVSADGVVDTGKLPDHFGVVGPDGEPVVCANGKKLRVETSRLFARPPRPAGEPPENPAGDLVWRCGTGRDPDRHPRLVPAG